MLCRLWQRIKTPGYVFYENNSSEVINADGALGDSFDVDAFRFALTAGVGYDWYLGGLWLTPEVSYEYPLLKVISESPGWKLQFLHASVRVGIAL